MGLVGRYHVDSCTNGQAEDVPRKAQLVTLGRFVLPIWADELWATAQMAMIPCC